MIVTVQQAISSGAAIEIPFPLSGEVMDEKKDFTALVKASGGVGAGGDAVMKLSVWADIDPEKHVVSGAPVDTDAWTNITRGVYRPDLNAMVDADEIEFTGAIPATAWLDMDDLNADRVKFRIEFSEAPSVTPASLIIKCRRDDV